MLIRKQYIDLFLNVYRATLNLSEHHFPDNPTFRLSRVYRGKIHSGAASSLSETEREGATELGEDATRTGS